MQYRDQGRDTPMSILGFGCMRFPRKAIGGFDVPEIERELRYAIEHGVNYFDTAYIYPGSEEVLGTVLKTLGMRDQVLIASKLPHYMVKQQADYERIFEEECKRLQTQRIDYYLMHMLPDVNVWERLKSIGIIDWLTKLKKEGRIGKVGFSFHGNTDHFIELLEAYDWEFCQIQYNYMDEHSQAGKRGLLAAAAKHIPVIIMEPLRGGRLVNDLPKKAKELLAKQEPQWSAAEWAFRWLWNQPEVTTILSGMNSMEMLQENIRIAEQVKAGAFSEKEFTLIHRLKDAINAKLRVPCTGCSYCMPCPKGVDIPGSFRCYNVSYTDGLFTGLKEYFMCTTLRAKKTNCSQCVECGKCASHCPQGIAIPQELKKVRKRLENIAYRIGAWFVRIRKMY